MGRRDSHNQKSPVGWQGERLSGIGWGVGAGKTKAHKGDGIMGRRVHEFLIQAQLVLVSYAFYNFSQVS